SKEIHELIVRMAKENRSWGYDRIVGALANLGYQVSDQAVGNVLRRHGIPVGRKKAVEVTRHPTAEWAEVDKIEIGDDQTRSDRETGVGGTRPTDLTDRPRQPLDGDQRPRFGCRRLQRANGRRHREPPDRRAQVSNVGSDRSQLANTAKAAKDFP